MPVLGQAPFAGLAPRPGRARLAQARRVVGAFARAFPEVSYEIVRADDVVNAQALRLAGRPSVLLYGGLLRHPAIGRDGLCFTLAHETGHLLGEGPRLPWDASLACECAADLWALRVGLPAIARATGWELRIDLALAELEPLLAVAYESVVARHACWSGSWPSRKHAMADLDLRVPKNCQFPI